MVLHPDLADVVRCPKCLGTLEEKEAGLVCAACRVVYPITDGIPNLLIEEARPLE